MIPPRMFVLATLVLQSLTNAAWADSRYLATVFSDAGNAASRFRGNPTPSPGSPLYQVYAIDLDDVYFESAPNVFIAGTDQAGGLSFADRGYLRVISFAGQDAQGGTFSYFGTNVDTISHAQMSFDDVVVTRTGGTGPPFTNVTIQLASQCLFPDPTAEGGIFDSALLTGFPSQPFGSVMARIDVAATLRAADGTYSGATQGSGIFNGSATYGAGPVIVGPTLTGVLAGKGDVIQTGVPFVSGLPFSGVPIGKPLELVIDLQTRVSGGYGFPPEGGLLMTRGSVQCTMSFAAAGFAQLGSGLTVDSVGAGVTNNVYDPVPEPDGWPTLMTSAFVLARLARRRERLSGHERPCLGTDPGRARALLIRPQPRTAVVQGIRTRASSTPSTRRTPRIGPHADRESTRPHEDRPTSP